MVKPDAKEKRHLLARNAVKAVGHLQGLMDEADTPEHIKPCLSVCLELLGRGMLGYPLKDERVVIEVAGGMARLVSKTDFVEVVIRDLDNEFEG